MIPSDTRKCKMCWELIQNDAIKCKHCWEYANTKYKWKWQLVKPWMFQKVFCTHCHEVTRPRTITKGSLIIEFILWFMILPWMTYSAHRSKSKYCVCRNCWSHLVNLI